MVTVWIHGAKSSSSALSCWQNGIPNSLMIDYTMDDGLYSIITNISKTIRNHTNEPVNLVGHSLGGVIATLLTKTSINVNKLVTVSAPFGGVSSYFVKKASAYSLIQRDVLSIQRRIPPSKPLTTGLFLVTTKGLNQTDGVIPISSQTALPVAYQYIDETHHSVLQSNIIATKIRWFLE